MTERGVDPGPDPGPDQGQPGLPGIARDSVRRAQRRRAAADKKTAAAAEPAPHLPVARVLVEVPLAHLDRPFDYLVPASMDSDALPGVRVKVRFAGKEVGGYLLERAEDSDHQRLQPLKRVVSAEPVLTEPVARLAASLAERYAGTRADVLRLAIPPRHAAAERKPAPDRAEPQASEQSGAAGTPHPAWAGHEGADRFHTALLAGASPRAVWAIAPGTDWPSALAGTVAAAYSSGRGALVCLPDHRDVARLDAALTEALGPDRHAVLTADAGPARRYRQFLAVSRGEVRVVIGTRAAAFAPVRDLGLVAIYDDGDDLFAEPRAPYPHTREVLLTRAEIEGTAALLAAPGRSVEAQHLIEAGWAEEIAAPRPEIRRRVTIHATGASEHDLARDAHARSARIPTQAHRTIRDALARGPVLVQTPRSGYAAALACDRCRTPARCRVCEGPLRQSDATRPPSCGWCGTADEAWRCGRCGDRGLRAPVIGDARTAEELGRAFPGVAVISSSGDRVRDRVPGTPAIVVCTPGAEPVADGGYAAVLILDPWWTLAREDLRVGEEALRRWLGAAVLVRGGGEVLIAGEAAHPAVQALIRLDPAGYAAREIAERREARLPPSTRVATITGEAGAVDDALTLLRAPEPYEVLGPVEIGDHWRAVIRTPRYRALELSRALGGLQRLRATRKLDAVRIQIDPVTL